MPRTRRSATTGRSPQPHRFPGSDNGTEISFGPTGCHLVRTLQRPLDRLEARRLAKRVHERICFHTGRPASLDLRASAASPYGFKQMRRHGPPTERVYSRSTSNLTGVAVGLTTPNTFPPANALASINANVPGPPPLTVTTIEVAPPQGLVAAPTQKLTAYAMSALRRNGPRVSQNHSPRVPAAGDVVSVL
jgi:hypothetical protein